MPKRLIQEPRTSRPKIRRPRSQTKDRQAKEEAEKDGQKSKTSNTDENGTSSAQRAKKPVSPAEFRSEEWETIYSRRIDDTIAALKSKGVPVIWAVCHTSRRSLCERRAYLNELYRARAERAGIKYVDVWDGFVDEAGKYSNYGPDYEARCRLRLNDANFLYQGWGDQARALCRTGIERYMSNRVPVALPSGPVEGAPSDSRLTERPLTGPVIPLTGTAKDRDKDSNSLLGAPAAARLSATRLPRKFWRTARQYPPGRADNFVWLDRSQTESRRGCTRNANCGPAQARVACGGPAKGYAQRFAAAPVDIKQQERKKGSGGKLTQQKPAKNSTPPQVTAPTPPQDDVPRPPMPIGPSGSSFDPRR